MKKLHELVRIVTSRRQKEIHLFDHDIINTAGQDVYHKLFELVKEKQLPTEEETAQLLYQCSPHDKRYQMMKSRFMQKLLNICFFLDVTRSGPSEYVKAEYELNRRLALCHILMPLGARHTVLHLASRCLKQAIYYQFSRHVVELCRILIILTSQTGNRRKYEYYLQLSDANLATYTAENRVMNFFSGIICDYSASASYKPLTVPRIKRFLNKERILGPAEPGFRYILYIYRLRMYYYDLSRQHEKCISLCKEAEAFIRGNKRFYSNKTVAEFGMQRMYAYVNLNKLLEAGKIAETYFPLSEKDLPYWFHISEQYYHLLMKTGRYAEAGDILHSVKNHKKLFTQSEATIEKWHIYSAYHYFIKDVGWLPAKKNAKQLGSFRLSKFLNEITVYSHDKAGLNISILILQFMFLIKGGKFVKIINKIDALKMYDKRHISPSILPRTSIFIKMLLNLYNSGFDVKKAWLSNKPLLKKMQEHESHAPGQFDESELISYELLWAYIEETLERPKGQSISQ